MAVEQGSRRLWVHSADGRCRMNGQPGRLKCQSDRYGDDGSNRCCSRRASSGVRGVHRRPVEVKGEKISERSKAVSTPHLPPRVESTANSAALGARVRRSQTVPVRLSLPAPLATALALAAVRLQSAAGVSAEHAAAVGTFQLAGNFGACHGFSVPGTGQCP